MVDPLTFATLISGVGAAAGGLASYLGSQNASEAQKEALKEALREQERMRQKTIDYYNNEGEKLSKFMDNYSQPFYEDSKKLSSGLVNELEQHEQSRPSAETINEHPIIKAINEQTERRMRPSLLKQGLWGSSAANQMAADALHNNQLNTYNQLADIHNKTRDSIVGSRAAALGQTQKMPETYASGMANFANAGMNAMGGANANAARNVASLGQAAGQQYYDTANILNNTIGNATGIADRYIKHEDDKRYKDALIKYMGQLGGKKVDNIY